MGFLHPEELRRCSACGEQWIAEHYTRLDAQPPIMGQGLTARSQALHRQTVHERRLNNYERWRYCPSCGSRKVKTVAKGARARKALHPRRRTNRQQDRQQPLRPPGGIATQTAHRNFAIGTARDGPNPRRLNRKHFPNAMTSSTPTCGRVLD